MLIDTFNRPSHQHNSAQFIRYHLMLPISANKQSLISSAFFAISADLRLDLWSLIMVLFWSCSAYFSYICSSYFEHFNKPRTFSASNGKMCFFAIREYLLFWNWNNNADVVIMNIVGTCVLRLCSRHCPCPRAATFHYSFNFNKVPANTKASQRHIDIIHSFMRLHVSFICGFGCRLCGCRWPNLDNGLYFFTSPYY